MLAPMRGNSMPLRDNDVEIVRVNIRQKRGPQQEIERFYDYEFTVRGYGPFHVEVPEKGFTKEWAYQLILKAASDQVDLLDAFPTKG